MMFRVRSARGQALAASIVLLTLLVGGALLATWRVQRERSNRETLEQRGAVVASLENARAQFFRGTVVITAAVFMEDPIPLIDSYHEAQVEGDESLEQARSGLVALGASDEINVLDSFAEQIGQSRQVVDGVLSQGAVADTSARVALGVQYYRQLWLEIESMMGDLGHLSARRP